MLGPIACTRAIKLRILTSAFEKRLLKFPCCTKNADATRDGDPLNLVVVESKRDPIVPFIARDWHLTRKLDIASIFETARAFVLRNEYLTSPVSPLYVFGRREDVALQKARSTINERIHARLWLSPYTFESREGVDRSSQPGYRRSVDGAHVELDYT